MSKKTVSILGDSYSTFEGYNRPRYDVWYPNEAQGVMHVEQTWWKMLCDEGNLELIENNSYSGSTVCNTGYGGMDSSFSSYVTRITNEMSDESVNSDILLIFGATNDFWSGAPFGEINYSWSGAPFDETSHSSSGVPFGETKYQEQTKEELAQFAPAFCYLLAYATKKYAFSEIYVIINDILPDYFQTVIIDVCNHYNVKTISLQNIDKIDGHPTVEGMKAIKEQVLRGLNA